MNYDALRTQLHDVAFTTATPFSDDRTTVLHDELERNLRTLSDAGATLYIPCGNTGEYYALSHSERIAVVRTTVETLDDEATVVAGAGGNIKNATELLEAYEEIGADAAMVMHPSHAYIHEEGLIEYYRALASATDLGIVIYKRGPEITDEVLSELVGLENVVGVKYAVNDVKGFSRTINAVSGDVAWLNGVAERFEPAYAMEGADGFTTGIGNFVPERVLALGRALADEDWEEAKRIRNLLRPYEDLREETGGGVPFGSAKNVPAVKYGMELRGMYGGPVRKPLVDLDDADKERARSYVEEIEHAPLA